LYRRNSVNIIVKVVMIDVGVLQVVHNLDRSVVINTFQSGNDFVLDLVLSKSASLADNTAYDFWHAALAYPFKANVNRKPYKDGYLIPDCRTTLPLTCVLFQNISIKSRSQVSPNQEKCLS
jgi:hypothetical protein